MMDDDVSDRKNHLSKMDHILHTYIDEVEIIFNKHFNKTIISPPHQSKHARK